MEKDVYQKSVYVIRSNDGEFIEEFIKTQCAGLGWELEDLETLDLKTLDTFEKIKSFLYELNPSKYQNTGSLGNVGGQIHRFLNVLQVGDVLLSKGKNKEVWQGIVESDAIFMNDEKYRFKLRRKVNWLKKMKTSELTESVNKSFCTNLTFFKVDSDYCNPIFETVCDIVDSDPNQSIEVDLISPPQEGNFVYCGKSTTHINFGKIGKAISIENRELSLFKDRTYSTYSLKLDVWIRVKDADMFERIFHRYFHKFRLCCKNGFGIDTELFHTPNFNLQEKFKFFIDTMYQDSDFSDLILEKSW